VLLSPRSFEQIEYIGHEIADYREYYFKRSKRDKDARAVYGQRRKDLTALKEDLYVLDIIREEMTLDDPRLQCHLSE
jgi:hypothetical protein